MNLLLEVLRRPERAATLTPAEWDRIVPQARRAGVLGFLAVQLEDVGAGDHLMDSVQAALEGARLLGAACARDVRWEVERIRAAIPAAVPLVLLKGAAYVMAGLQAARGRRFSDVDLLVPKEALGAAEKALIRHGWEHIKLEPYDQRYYRRWMHELPPMRHRARRTVVDVHHTILPTTGRLRPDARALFAAAVPMGKTGVGVLSPPDMVLHAAVHLFQDGDLQAGMRDLCDIDALLRELGRDSGFWPWLVGRARQLGLARPLFYALRYGRRLLETPVPPADFAEAAKGGPPWPVSAVMDLLVERVLLPQVDPPARGEAAAASLLYMRAHWLRMPPHLLARHLLHQSLRRWPSG